MKNNKAKLLAVAVAMGMSAHASAAIELYNQDGVTFSADGHFNAFYTQTDTDYTDATIAANIAYNANETDGITNRPVADEDQSRVRMGFLPNWIGFNVSKEMDGLTVGGRSSFWVTINDGHNNVTDTGIDIRQFYGTVDGDFGQVLFGKDFGLYARSNIFSDELLLGTGLPQPSSGGVTLGNISTGYPYATPVAQITYRTPVTNGFQLAVGVMDPDSGETANNGGNNSARFEAEGTFATDFDGGKFNAWLGAASGESNDDGGSVHGVAYGARVSMGGFQFTASGFDQEGIGAVFADTTTDSDTDSDGYLVQAAYQAGDHRFILSHGESDVNGAQDRETDAVAYFYNVNSNLKIIAEYDMFEDEAGNEIDQFAVGAALSW